MYNIIYIAFNVYILFIGGWTRTIFLWYYRSRSF